MKDLRRLRITYLWACLFSWILFRHGFEGSLFDWLLILVAILALVIQSRLELKTLALADQALQHEREMEKATGRKLPLGAPGCWREDSVE